MSLIAIGSARHSPGVSATVLALASAWPTHRRVLAVEADPAGGDWICHYRLLAEPTTVTLAAAGRSGVDAESLWANTQRLPGDPGVEVVAAPVDARQARAALSSLVRVGVGDVLARLADTDVLADVGRLDPDSPALELFAAADVAAMAVRPTLNQIDHLRARLDQLEALGVLGVQLVVVGEGQWRPAEVAAHAGAAGVLAVLPDDPRGAGALVSGGQGSRGLRRSPLWRSARQLGAALVAAAEPTERAADEPEDAAATPVAAASSADRR